MLDRALRHRWMDALRSGTYSQAKGTLFDPTNNSYCCLGVLCAIQDPNWKEKFEDLETCKILRFGLGMSEEAANHLVNLNDGGNLTKPATFASIADWLDLSYESFEENTERNAS